MNFPLLSLIVTGLSVTLGFFSLFLGRKKSRAEKAVALAKVVQTIPSAIVEAEKLYPNGGQGAAKLAYVLSKLELTCYKLNVNYEENVDGLKAEVEKVLEAPQKKSYES